MLRNLKSVEALPEADALRLLGAGPEAEADGDGDADGGLNEEGDAPPAPARGAI
ncbi:hypothetical protein D3C81_2211340 [compost metagenome]